MTHKVKDESSRLGTRSNIVVTLTCTGCDRKFFGSAGWQMKRESREHATFRARQRAETEFREHLSIR